MLTDTPVKDKLENGTKEEVVKAENTLYNSLETENNEQKNKMNKVPQEKKKILKKEEAEAEVNRLRRRSCV